jgi:hypothetical protein
LGLKKGMLTSRMKIFIKEAGTYSPLGKEFL